MHPKKINTPRIGIIGATGFIGSYLLKYFSTKHPELKLTALARQNLLPNNYPNNINWQIGDLLSKNVCKQLIKNIDTLIYLAHTNTPLTSNEDIVADARLNLGPLINLLETIKECQKPIHIIYASSGGAIYGDTITKKPFKETDPCQPISSYGIQKLTAEHYLRLYSSWGFIKTTILRISNPYGILLPPERKQGLIGIAIGQTIKNDTINIFNDINTIRDYIHLDDLCEAIIACCKNTTSFNIYNIASGRGYSILEVLKIIEKITKIKIKYKIIKNDSPQSSPKWNVLNINKVESELNWSPKIRLIDGIKQTYESVSNTTSL